MGPGQGFGILDKERNVFYTISGNSYPTRRTAWEDLKKLVQMRGNFYREAVLSTPGLARVRVLPPLKSPALEKAKQRVSAAFKDWKKARKKVDQGGESGPQPVKPLKSTTLMPYKGKHPPSKEFGK